jgi:hypothetical protein
VWHDYASPATPIGSCRTRICINLDSGLYVSLHCKWGRFLKLICFRCSYNSAYNHKTWIGMEDKHNSAVSVNWIDGSTVDFKNPGKLTLDNWHGNNEGCVELVDYSGFRWNDVSCSANINYICREGKIVAARDVLGRVRSKTRGYRVRISCVYLVINFFINCACRVGVPPESRRVL